ncbi:MAG: carbohydrate kinase family protein [Candidatus Thorarchaeota archaeon]|jgi:sugar/nucleoside kinase (ribokinase family)
MYDIVVLGNPAYYESKKRDLASGAVYSAITASKLGVENVAFVGAVGDALQKQVVQIFNEHDIEFFLLDSAETDRFQVSLDPEGNEFAEMVATKREIGIRDIPDEFLRAKIIMLSPVLREIHAEFIEWLSDSSDSMIFFDPRFRRISDENRVKFLGNHRVAEGILSSVDVIKPNRFESKIMTGEDDPLLAVEMLVESGCEIAIITLSEDGSIIFDGKDFFRIPAFKVQTANGIGAGDSYLSSFAVKMLEGSSIVKCGAYASAVASIVVESTIGPDFILNSRDVQGRTDVLLEEATVR